MIIIAEAAISRVATDNYYETKPNKRTYDKNNFFRDGTYAKRLRDEF